MLSVSGKGGRSGVTIAAGTEGCTGTGGGTCSGGGTSTGGTQGVCALVARKGLVVVPGEGRKRQVRRQNLFYLSSNSDL